MFLKHCAFALLLATVLVSCSNIGEQAPSFEFQTLDGSKVSSESLKGKIVVVNVWATWCHTCISELPDLNRLYAKYQGDTSIVFLAFSDEDEATVKAGLQRFPFNYPQIVNADGYTKKIQTRLVKTYPQNLILDEDLTIIYEVSDGSNDIFTTLDTKIQELTQQSTTE